VATRTDTSASAEQVAQAYFERVAARDPDGMMELWTPGGQGHIDGVVELVAPDSYGAWFRNLFAAFPDWQFEVLSITAQDDRAAVRWGATGTFNGTASFEGMLPTGAQLDVTGIDLLRVEDGKLVELWAYMNQMEMARQLGAMPPQGSAPERAMFAALNLKTRAVNALKRR
jgi:predicted ester cyclase